MHLWCEKMMRKSHRMPEPTFWHSTLSSTGNRSAPFRLVMIIPAARGHVAKMHSLDLLVPGHRLAARSWFFFLLFLLDSLLVLRGCRRMEAGPRRWRAFWPWTAIYKKMAATPNAIYVRSSGRDMTLVQHLACWTAQLAVHPLLLRLGRQLVFVRCSSGPCSCSRASGSRRGAPPACRMRSQIR